MFNNIWAIAQKELQGYFASSSMYAIAACFWFVSGFFFIQILISDRGIIQQVLYREQTSTAMVAVDVATEFLNSYLAVLGTLSLLIVPVLSMGLYAEEKKLGTMELLATSPITNWAVASGKLIAVTLVFVFLLLPSFLLEAIAFSAARPPLPFIVPFLAHLGLILMVTALLSIGMFISSLTSSNVLAAVLTFATILVFWTLDLIASNTETWLAKGLEYISLLESYNNLVKGVLMISDLILFLSYIFLGLFLTSQSIDLFCSNRK